jgi:selenocysteine lyase/cysteine desulfurase
MAGVLGGAAALSPLAGCGGSDAVAQVDPGARERLARAAQPAAVERGLLGPTSERLHPDAGRLYMNIGTAGAMPKMTVDKFNADNVQYAAESRSGYSNFLTERTAIARGTPTAPGNGFGVDPDELVISYNTSEGMSHAMLGIQWQAGDTVITTNRSIRAGTCRWRSRAIATA